MKVFRALVFLVLLSGPFTAFASGPDDDYVGIYNLIQRGDAFGERGEPEMALAKYVEAQNALIRFQSSYPDWNLKIVSYRLRYLATQISDLSYKVKNAPVPVTNAAPATNKIAVPAPAPSLAPVVAPIPTVSAPMIVAPPRPAPVIASPAKPLPSSDSENQIKALQGQIRRMEADNATLQAKLKEAFSAQPAAVSPQELSRAQARVLELQKQNDLLLSAAAAPKTAVPAVTGNSSNDKLRRELAAANERVKQLTTSNSWLQMDKDALLAQVASLSGGNTSLAALRSENDLLKKDLADLKTRAASPSTPAGDDSATKLQQAQAQLAVLQSEKEVLRTEKVALENRFKELYPGTSVVAATNSASPQAGSAVAVVDSDAAGRIAQLQSERAILQKNLDAATQDAAGRKKGKVLAARMDELTREVAGLKAHIGVLEAGAVPYTPDELDLLNKPATVLIGASTHRPKNGHRELSPNAAALAKEGQRLFVDKKFDQAEQKYESALATDPTNVVALADLASVQLEAGHLAEAEQNVKRALAVDPEDDYSLYVLGQVKFQQKDYDAALNALSRASEITPQNANVRNFIGLALDEKGLRSQAETAFRRAIQLDPEFAEAHMNLAVVYATQKPPLIQLAKWHYQKAMAIGHSPNRALEKMLDDITNASTAAAH